MDCQLGCQSTYLLEQYLGLEKLHEQSLQEQTMPMLPHILELQRNIFLSDMGIYKKEHCIRFESACCFQASTMGMILIWCDKEQGVRAS